MGKKGQKKEGHFLLIAAVFEEGEKKGREKRSRSTEYTKKGGVGVMVLESDQLVRKERKRKDSTANEEGGELPALRILSTLCALRSRQKPREKKEEAKRYNYFGRKKIGGKMDAVVILHSLPHSRLNRSGREKKEKEGVEEARIFKTAPQKEKGKRVTPLRLPPCLLIHRAGEKREKKENARLLGGRKKKKKKEKPHPSRFAVIGRGRQRESRRRKEEGSVLEPEGKKKETFASWIDCFVFSIVTWAPTG